MLRPWGAEAQRRLAEILPPLVRNSGAFAESRVKSILAKKGVAGVLDEIGLVTSDYARRVYYVALLDNVALDGASLATVLQQVGSGSNPITIGAPCSNTSPRARSSTTGPRSRTRARSKG